MERYINTIWFSPWDFWMVLTLLLCIISVNFNVNIVKKAYVKNYIFFTWNPCGHYQEVNGSINPWIFYDELVEFMWWCLEGNHFYNIGKTLNLFFTHLTLSSWLKVLWYWWAPMPVAYIVGSSPSFLCSMAFSFIKLIASLIWARS